MLTLYAKTCVAPNARRCLLILDPLIVELLIVVPSSQYTLEKIMKI
jgi:hypothetical protein